jgi:hypothetical protein
MSGSSFPARKWAFGLDGLPRSERLALVTISNKDLEPVGQLEPRDEGPRARAEVSKEKKKEFLEKKAWEVATAPGKQFMMTGVHGSRAQGSPSLVHQVACTNPLPHVHLSTSSFAQARTQLALVC